MKTFDFDSTIKNFNILTGEIVLRLDFPTPEILKEFEKYSKQPGKLFRFTSPVLVEQISYTENQRKCWYGSIAEILKTKNTVPSPTNIKIYDTKMRESIFPVKYFQLDGKDEPYVPEMKELSTEEMGNCIEVLHSRHPNINWDKWKEMVK